MYWRQIGHIYAHFAKPQHVHCNPLDQVSV